MSDAKLMMVELTAEEDADMRALIDAGKVDEVEEFLLRKVYNGDAKAMEQHTATVLGDLSSRKRAQTLALRVLRQELREQVLRDVLDALHWLLHQKEYERATTLACASDNMLDGESSDLGAVQHVLHEVEAVRTAKEKMSCRGNA